MARTIKIAAFAFGLGLSATTLHGQSAAIPAEFPPADFTGNQFVDSQGCAFVRAGVGGVTTWVPRLNRQRGQLCNFQPTFPAGTSGPAPATASVPVAPLDAPIIEITPDAAPEPTVAEATARTRSAPAPAAAPAPARAPAVAAPIRTAASLPRPAPVASPRVVAPAPAAAPEPRRITLAEACAGRSGVQPGMISASTGRPIDCGPAPAPRVAPVVAAAAPAPAPAAPEPRRMTLAAICADVAENGTRYVRPDGSAINCGQTAPVKVAAAPVAKPTPPAGYTHAWTDGRINPQRGQVAQSDARASSRAAPASKATVHRYVQVGTFGVPSNAERMISRLSALGYPVSSAKSGQLKVIAAGPFENSAEVSAALRTVRGMGFTDAFTRN